MNDYRRGRLKAIAGNIGQLIESIEEILEDEENQFESLNDDDQQTESGYELEQYVTGIDEIGDKLREVKKEIKNIINREDKSNHG